MEVQGGAKGENKKKKNGDRKKRNELAWKITIGEKKKKTGEGGMG